MVKLQVREKESILKKESVMVIDFSFILYSYILILAVSVILLASVLSLASWRLIKYVKSARERHNKLFREADKQMPGALHPPPVGHA